MPLYFQSFYVVNVTLLVSDKKQNDIKKGEKSPVSMNWHFELWTKNLSCLGWRWLFILLAHQDWQLSQRGWGWNDLYVTADIMEILSVASSEEGGAWRQAPQRRKIPPNQSSGWHFFLLNISHLLPIFMALRVQAFSISHLDCSPTYWSPILPVFSLFCGLIIFPEPAVVLSPFLGSPLPHPLPN